MKYRILIPGNPLRTSIGSLGASSVTLVENDDLKILIDTSHYGRRKLLLQEMEANHIAPSSIDYVILTHLHWDHVLNYDLFQNSEFLISSAELEYNLEVSEDDPYSFRNFRKISDKLQIIEVPNKDYVFKRGISIYSTPGHTKGHMVVLSEDKDHSILNTGDAIPNLRAWFRGKPDIITGHPDDASRSAELIKNLGQHSVIIPGHDPPFTVQDNKGTYTFREKVNLTFREDREMDFSMTVGEEDSKLSYM